MITIAIDPGAKGAIAYRMGNVARAMRCPDNEVEMSQLITTLRDVDECRAIIEEVSAMPGNGAVGMFHFGRNFGGWLGILSASGVSHKLVKPMKWQKFIPGLPHGKEVKKERKDALKAYSARLYPGLRVTLVNADALAMLDVFAKVWEE